MREIKFRCFLHGRMYQPFNPFDGTDGGWDTDSIFLQFTGLHDDDGKEVWEGDIIEFELGDGLENERGIVRFSEDGFWTSSASDVSEELLSEELADLNAKVIGNFYEHKHLLP